ncbi:class I adenylate-forming enzyme family protein [Marinobacter sp.]|uniref:class I adenylate-forming enzyme family protein n=1 Tax=Marinobacter sp. TaxID=50741 RepID=UPI00384BC593
MARIEVGTRVLLSSSNTVETAAAFVALWHLGATIVPVKAPLPPEGLNELARDCNARLLYCPESRMLDALASYAPERALFVTRSRRVVTGCDLALIIYTSGSTGRPKGIMLSHANVISALRSIAFYLKMAPTDRILCLSPLSFDYGLYQLLLTLYCNCDLVLYNEMFHPVKLINAIEKHEVTVVPAVPLVATLLLKGLSLSPDTCFPTLRCITNTGGHLPVRSILELRRRLPHALICPMYGLTESKRALYLPPEDIDRKPGSVGIPMPGLDAKVFREALDDTGNTTFVEVNDGEVGTLFVRGSSVMQGYRNAARGGAEIVAGDYRDDNWLCTGDLFRRDEEGYFFFAGREKELIKQGGFCLYPSEIEALVQSNDQVELAVAVASEDPFGNETACLFVKLTESGDRREFGRWLTQRLARDYTPRRIEFIDQLPYTTNGKIDKKALQKQLASGQ